MGALADKVIDQLYDLPYDDFQIVANQVLSMLHPKSEEVDQAWRTEVNRRVEEIRSGKVELIDGKTAMAELRAKFS